MSSQMYCIYTESTYTGRVRDDIEKYVLMEGEEAFVPVMARRMKIQKDVCYNEKIIINLTDR